ncbi:MAG TPA: F0F1 ATP synthase subunit delta [Gammaproteobacteria bacterium]
MAESITLARPYAKAVFELAHGNKALDAWSKALTLLASLIGDHSVQVMLHDPQIPATVRAQVFIDLCEKAAQPLDQHGKNFVRLLAENRRLLLLPEIAADYETLRAQAENFMEVELRAASPVDAAEQKRISDALHKKLGRRIELKYVEDKSLIGGAVLRAGDFVIDGSVRGKLGRLAAALTR